MRGNAYRAAAQEALQHGRATCQANGREHVRQEAPMNRLLTSITAAAAIATASASNPRERSGQR